MKSWEWMGKSPYPWREVNANHFRLDRLRVVTNFDRRQTREQNTRTRGRLLQVSRDACILLAVLFFAGIRVYFPDEANK